MQFDVKICIYDTVKMYNTTLCVLFVILIWCMCMNVQQLCRADGSVDAAIDIGTDGGNSIVMFTEDISIEEFGVEEYFDTEDLFVDDVTAYVEEDESVNNCNVKNTRNIQHLYDNHIIIIISDVFKHWYYCICSAVTRQFKNLADLSSVMLDFINNDTYSTLFNVRKCFRFKGVHELTSCIVSAFHTIPGRYSKQHPWYSILYDIVHAICLLILVSILIHLLMYFFFFFGNKSLHSKQQHQVDHKQEILDKKSLQRIYEAQNKERIMIGRLLTERIKDNNINNSKVISNLPAIVSIIIQLDINDLTSLLSSVATLNEIVLLAVDIATDAAAAAGVSKSKNSFRGDLGKVNKQEIQMESVTNNECVPDDDANSTTITSSSGSSSIASVTIAAADTSTDGNKKACSIM